MRVPVRALAVAARADARFGLCERSRPLRRPRADEGFLPVGRRLRRLGW